MNYPMRIARPVVDLERSAAMYCQGLGLTILDRFENHGGFDGVMLGKPGLSYHWELTVCRSHPVAPAPTPEDLLVFYIEDRREWETRCRLLDEAGFERVSSFNPYWDLHGRTFADPDGYRLVLENGTRAWPG